MGKYGTIVKKIIDVHSKSCHLLEVDAAAAISIIKSKSPGQFLVVGPLPADTNCQQPFPDKDKYVINTLNIRKNDSET